MKQFNIKTYRKKMLADTVTPVSIFLKVRDRFANSALLESSDYHAKENSFSYICFDPVAGFKVENDKVEINYPDGTEITKSAGETDVVTELTNFSQAFNGESQEQNFVSNGLFGYMSFDAVRYYEDVDIKTFESDERRVPDLLYQLYRYIIVVNHFKDELYVFQHDYTGSDKENLDFVETLIRSRNFASYHFYPEDKETSNLTDDEFLKVIQKGKDHCHRGDVFQIVLSRRFSRGFSGDEFNVYRALRSINPSPYLFYFDYGSFKIFGSSPEAQILIKNNKATIHPIAGTFLRTGDDKDDAEQAEKLFDDPKENSEHIMLVDLARNDLSRSGRDVKVETFKEIQFYSHVIHLVSKVTGIIEQDVSSLKLVGDTFPAGTLSGAPKYMAVKLINRYESGNRGYYGGAIGYIGFNGDFNHAIMIRSMLSKKNKLFYQAGAGVVAKSVIESELQEVDNKLLALRTAIKEAKEI